MVFFNYSTKEITGKIVYYGPGLCGKTTNLQYIYRKLDPSTKGKMLSLATEADRTLFFDFLPVKLGTIRGMKIRFQLYTVPGQVFYNETRKLVLKGADAIVFVADSQKTMMEANIESYINMEENLNYNGLDSDTLPLCLQFNKRDLPNLSSIDELNKNLNKRGVSYNEAIAIQGKGVIETFQNMGKILMNEIVRKHKLKIASDKQTDVTPEVPKAEPVKPAVKAEPKVTPKKIAVPKEEKLEVYHGHDVEDDDSGEEVIIKEEDAEVIELEGEDTLQVNELEQPQLDDEIVEIDNSSVGQFVEEDLHKRTPKSPPVLEPLEDQTAPDKQPLREVTPPLTANLINEVRNELSKNISDLVYLATSLKQEVNAIKKELDELKKMQRLLQRDITKQKEEIISALPEIKDSRHARKIFRLP